LGAALFLEADTALYIGCISSNPLFAEEKKRIGSIYRLYQPLKKKRKESGLQIATFLGMDGHVNKLFFP
jgi:hypothetical protein